LSVAVLILLAGLFFSIFFRLRENGLRSSCQDRLRRLALAVSQYVDDQNGQYPGGSFWMRSLAPYAKVPEVFHCPAVGNHVAETDYWINDRLNRLTSGGKRPMSVVMRADTFLNGDLSADFVQIKDRCGTRKYYLRHLKGANYSFV